MLKKLLKYDFINIYKGLVIFYSLSLFFSIIARLFIGIDNSFIMNIIGNICVGVAISMMFNVLINNFIRLWVKFKQNLYGDESYLTHTLPIEKKTLYLSKIISLVVSLFTSVLVIALSLFIIYYSKDNLEVLRNMLLSVAEIYDSSTIKLILVFLFIFFIEAVNMLQCGFTGIILGHRMNNIKAIYSFVFGFLSYMAIQVFGLFVIFIVALFNSDLMNLFFTNEVISLDMVKLIIYLSISIYSITFIIFYFINVNLFNKGVNVD